LRSLPNRKKEAIPFAGYVTAAVSLAEASDAVRKSVEHLTGVLLAASSREDAFRKELVEALSNENPAAAAVALMKRQSKEMRESYDSVKAVALYRHLARNRTWQTPTLTVLRSMANLGDPNFVADVRLKYVSAGYGGVGTRGTSPLCRGAPKRNGRKRGGLMIWR